MEFGLTVPAVKLRPLLSALNADPGTGETARIRGGSFVAASRTEIVTGADTVRAASESLAMAVRVYSPGSTPSHRKRYGAALSSPSLLVPSKNSTFTTPSLSEASASRSRLVGPKNLSWATGRTNSMNGEG